MNRIGEREYIQLIADALVEEYGESLKEYGTDVAMVEAVLYKLEKFLFFDPVDISPREFKKWKRLRKSGLE
jgi:hypothetical protein